jgi:hypothetical protein
MKIKVNKFNDYNNFFIADKESIKNWLTKKGWTALHAFQKKALGHVPIEDVFKAIDDGIVGISTKTQEREGHQMSILIGTESTLYYITEITKDDLEIDEETTITGDILK